MEAAQEIYATRTVSPRWPRLVRERATEGWHERQAHRPNVLDSLQGRVGTADLVDTVDIVGTRRPGGDDPEAYLEHTRADATSADPEDELFLLGERCAQAYMQADALHYQAMKLLAEFDGKNGWQDTGFSSTAEWLAWRIGIKAGAARERVRTALALEQLPLASEAMRRGELSFTKVRALTRVATAENEGTLLDFARAGSAANLERMVRGWKTLDRKSEVTAEQIRHRTRRFSAFVDDDGPARERGPSGKRSPVL